MSLIATQQLPFTNGRRFTDSWGYAKLPILCDEVGNEQTLWCDHESCGRCHVCDADTGDAPIVAYPCVLRPRLSDGVQAFDEFQGVCIANELLAQTVFDLCENCTKKCEVLMKTSDHVAVGKNWWDLLDSLTETLSTYELPKTEFPVSNIVTDTAKSMCIIEDSVNAETGPLTCLYKDVLYVIASKMIDAHKCAAANKIRNAYLKWRDSKWKEEKFAGDEPSFESHYYGCRHEEWAYCSDCGMVKHCSDLIMTATLCQQAECDAEKWVCKDGCTYVCQHCDCTNRVSHDVHISHHANDDNTTDPYDRTTTPWTCYHCNRVMMLTVDACCHH